MIRQDETGNKLSTKHYEITCSKAADLFTINIYDRGSPKTGFQKIDESVLHMRYSRILISTTFIMISFVISLRLKVRSHISYNRANSPNDSLSLPL